METKNPNLKFWIDLVKWFIVSVALVVMTTIIDWGFRDRQAGLNELKFYDRYVTELIVLNPSPVQKRMLAQYFACVTPSEKLRERWIIYYDSIYREYATYIRPFMEEEKILQQQYQTLLQSPLLDGSKRDELRRMEARLAEIRQVLFPEINVPDIEPAGE